MRTFVLAMVAAMATTSAMAETTVPAPAPVLSGEVSLDFAETTNNNYGGTMGLDLGVDLGGTTAVDLNFEAVDGGALKLDTWAVGTVVGSVGVAFGDDLGIMPGAEGEQTLAAPAMAEAVQVMVGDAKVAVGLTDWTADVTDISNVQGAYTFNLAPVSVTAMADYNLDSENTVLGAELAGVEMGALGLGGAATYDVDAELFGFEGVVTAGGITAYANGDDTDMLQNVGGEYTMDVGGAAFTAGANYNVDTEDFTPTAGVAFAF